MIQNCYLATLLPGLIFFHENWVMVWAEEVVKTLADHIGQVSLSTRTGNPYWVYPAVFFNRGPNGAPMPQDAAVFQAPPTGSHGQLDHMEDSRAGY